MRLVRAAGRDMLRALFGANAVRRLGDGEFADMYMECGYGWWALEERYPEEKKAWEVLRTIFGRFGSVYRYNFCLKYGGEACA